MKNKRYDRIQESKEWGKLSVTPEHVFQVDKEKEFGNFTHLSWYLDTIIQSKLDLITLLHFSDLKKIKTSLFFTLSGIDIEEFSKLKLDNAKQKIKNILFDEQIKDFYWLPKWKTSIIDTRNQRKREFPIEFDNFLFKHGGVYDDCLIARQVPQTEIEQKEFLSQLIDQWFFDVKTSYKHRDSLLSELISNMWFFVAWRTWTIYPKEYTKWIIMEWYIRWKLSDYCLWILLMSWLQDRTTYAENILFYLEELRPYPELIKRILACIEIYFTQKKK